MIPGLQDESAVGGAEPSEPSGDVSDAVNDQAFDTNPSESDGEDAVAEGESADAADDVIDETGAPEGAKEWIAKTNKAVQQRLRESAKAVKEAEALRKEYEELRHQHQGVVNILRSKEPAKALELLRELAGVEAKGAEKSDAAFKFNPKKRLSSDEAQEELSSQFDDFGAQMLAYVERRFSDLQQPLVEKVGRSEEVVRDRAWEKVTAEYGPDAARWRKQTEALVERGMPLEEALMAASKGEAYGLKLKKRQVAQKAKGVGTPALPPRGRSPVGASVSGGGKRRLSDYFAK